MCIYENNKVKEQFGRKMNQNIKKNRKLFLKEITKVNGGKVESCSRIWMEMRSWRWKRLKWEELGRSILRIFMIYLPKNV